MNLNVTPAGRPLLPLVSKPDFWSYLPPERAAELRARAARYAAR